MPTPRPNIAATGPADTEGRVVIGLQLRILIAGYFGFTNVGDEAVLATMIQDLRSAMPDVAITVTSQSPSETARAYDVDVVDWHLMSQVFDEIERSNLVLLGGGGLFNSYLTYEPDVLLTQGHSLFSSFVFGTPIAAALARRPTVVFGVGASEILTEGARRHARAAIAFATACCVRDFGSKEILTKLGCDPERIEVTADPAFNLASAAHGTVSRLLRAQSIDHPGPTIGVVLRNWPISGDAEQRDAAVARSLTSFTRELHAQVLFIPFDHFAPLAELSQDTDAIERVRSRLPRDVRSHVLSGIHPPEVVAGIVARCDVVLGMRLHAVVLSAKSGVPFVALNYDQKVRNMAEMIGMRDYVVEDAPTLDADLLLERLHAAYRDRVSLRVSLTAAAQAMVARTRRNVEIVLEVLSGHRRSPPLQQAEVEFLLWLARKQTRMVLALKRQLVDYEQSWVQRQHTIRQLVDSGRYEEAYARIQPLLAPTAAEAEASYLAAFCLQQLGRNPQDALAHYERALRGGFERFWIHYNRASLLLGLGRRNEAIEDLARAVELDPKHRGVQALQAQLSPEQQSP